MHLKARWLWLHCPPFTRAIMQIESQTVTVGAFKASVTWVQRKLLFDFHFASLTFFLFELCCFCPSSIFYYLAKLCCFKLATVFIYLFIFKCGCRIKMSQIGWWQFEFSLKGQEELFCDIRIIFCFIPSRSSLLRAAASPAVEFSRGLWRKHINLSVYC